MGWSREEDTRKSFSGGAAALGTELKQWCNSQASVSLSSGEAEVKACVMGLIEGLYMKNMLKQQGVDIQLRLHTDSAAALGHCSRLGPGKRMRHLEGAEIWIQQVLRSGAASVVKIDGKENPADLFTKYLTRNEIIRHMSVLGFELKDAEDVPLGCKDLALSLVSAAAEEEEEDSEVDMQLGGVLMTYADKFKVRRLKPAV